MKDGDIMTNEDKVHELFAALKNRPPFITEEYVRELVRKDLLQRQSGFSFGVFFDHYRTRFIWAATCASLLVISFVFYFTSYKVAKAPTATIHPHIEMKHPALEPKLEDSSSKAPSPRKVGKNLASTPKSNQRMSRDRPRHQ